MPSIGQWELREEQCRQVKVEDIPLLHPVQVFHDYFMSKRSADGFLDRANFDPADNPRLLPWVQILEEIEADVFRHRVVGTAVVELLGRDNTGKLFGDGITEELKRKRTEEFRTAFATGEPVLTCSASMHPERSFITVFRGVFPGRAGATRLIFLPVAATEKRLSD